MVGVVAVAEAGLRALGPADVLVDEVCVGAVRCHEQRQLEGVRVLKGG